MPPMRLNTGYDALVIVMDDTEEEGCFFQKETARTFEKQKLLYYKKYSDTAEALFQDVLQNVKAYKTIMPNSNRIVFCQFLDINDLNEEWMERYRERMEYFRNMGMVSDGYQHYYLTFFRYQAVHPLKEHSEDVIETLQKFWNNAEPFTMAHVEFLLYAGGLQTLEDPERGAVRLLYLLSTIDYWRVYNRNNFGQGLYLITYEDYYEKRAQDCQADIKAVDEWLSTARDGNFMELETSTREMVKGITDRYKEETRQFQRWSGLYPVSVKDFTSHGFGPFKTYSRNTRKHAELEQEELEQEKENLQKRFIDGIEEAPEKARWLSDLESHMNYPDYIAYEKGLEDQSILGRIENKVRECLDRESADEQRPFIELFQKWFREFIEEKTESLEEIKTEKKDFKTMREYEMQKANRFNNLSHCFSKIKQETQFQIPPIITPAEVEEITLVNGEIGSNWVTNGYSVTGVPASTVAVLPEIAPFEIQYIRLASYITVQPGQTVADKLKLVLK